MFPFPPGKGAQTGTSAFFYRLDASFAFLPDAQRIAVSGEAHVRRVEIDSMHLRRFGWIKLQRPEQRTHILRHIEIELEFEFYIHSRPIRPPWRAAFIAGRGAG